jgi:hypothetical protein
MSTLIPKPPSQPARADDAVGGRADRRAVIGREIDPFVELGPRVDPPAEAGGDRAAVRVERRQPAIKRSRASSASGAG